MTGQRRSFGIGASAGIAVGPAALVRRMEPDISDHPAGLLGVEPLAQAIKTAISAIQSLADATPTNDAAILDFQIEMLRDPTLFDMAAERIGKGEDAAIAWIGTMDSFITGFQGSDDELMGARAVDVIDMKNRVLDIMMGRPTSTFPAGSIYVGRDIEPSLFLAHDWSDGGGIVLFNGSTASHVATLARARSVPMVTGIGPIELGPEEILLVDGSSGSVITDPQPADMTPSLSNRGRPGTSPDAHHRSDAGKVETADGIPVQVSVNISVLSELDRLDPTTTAGVGLLRTEFLLSSPSDIFNEEEQFAAYRRILEWAQQKPVVIRLFDLGGDKAFPTIAGEHGSFLGLRGVRLLLSKPEILRVQARALLRAAAFGQLRIMLPMVTIPAEVDAAAAILKEEADLLSIGGKFHPVPPLGMMVEVPAAALMLETFYKADFFSFGTNDLGQYLVAAARDNPAVAGLHAEAPPAIYRLIAASLKGIDSMSRPVSICGDMASDPACLGSLLKCGLRHFSVTPSRLMAVKSAIRALNANAPQTAAD
ncbi:putative PEP-binding protein [Rhizobium tubonense]|uniref:Phosphoenolpyruvate-protein phosphotransferase n=1 Tax=Rhizobium tubonense TaxID=484088 RepID=A0A2W4ESE4_9HYPH|nr:putative PEP-binding protein [Rhizobium tubonense]PZM16256.1 phosphoenolpyruvate protein kinase [Rhizobium tubonense]